MIPRARVLQGKRTMKRVLNILRRASVAAAAVLLLAVGVFLYRLSSRIEEQNRVGGEGLVRNRAEDKYVQNVQFMAERTTSFFDNGTSPGGRKAVEAGYPLPSAKLRGSSRRKADIFYRAGFRRETRGRR